MTLKLCQLVEYYIRNIFTEKSCKNVPKKLLPDSFLHSRLGQILLLVMHYLTKFDRVIKRLFLVIPKITSANLCKAIDDIINYSTFIYPFESGKCGKEGKKIQKFEYLKN